MPKERNRFTRTTDYTLYLALRLAHMVMNAWPVEVNLAVAGACGEAYFNLVAKHRRRAMGNIRRCFPHLPERQVQDIARRSLRQMFMLGVEFLFTPRLVHAQNFTRRIQLSDFQQTLDLMIRRHRGLILLTGHYGNWEVLGYVLATLGFPTLSVARPLDNPHVNRFVFGVRERMGQKIIAKKGATEAVAATLEQRGIVGFIADQNAGPKGLFVDFFGRKASTYKSIGLLAVQYEVPVVVGYARRVEGRYQFQCGTQDVILPADWQAQDNPLLYITQRYTKALEDIVRADPSQYLWVHRRWKTRPRGEAAEEFD